MAPYLKSRTKSLERFQHGADWCFATSFKVSFKLAKWVFN